MSRGARVGGGGGGTQQEGGRRGGPQSARADFATSELHTAKAALRLADLQKLSHWVILIMWCVWRCD